MNVLFIIIHRVMDGITQRLKVHTAQVIGVRYVIRTQYDITYYHQWHQRHQWY